MSEIPNQYLKLSNGAILPDCAAGCTGEHLWLYLKMPMSEVVQIAMNPEVLQTIEFHYGSLYSLYEGYTKLNAIIDRNEQFKIEVRLIGGHIVKEDEPYEGDSSGDGTDVVSESSGSES